MSRRQVALAECDDPAAPALRASIFARIVLRFDTGHERDMPELDANIVATGVANHIFDSLAAGASAALKPKLAKIKVAFSRQLERYSAAIMRKTSRVKTIVHPDEAAHIDDIYVPLSYQISGDEATDKSIRAAFNSSGKILIFGTAGGGKSILIKKLCSDMLRDGSAKVPIFYELRYLNSLDSKDLLDAILKSIKDHATSYSMEMLEASFESGRFGLVLDGFDEIDHDFRQKIGLQIEEIVDKYPELSVIITSRPEDNLPGLSSFSVYHALRMSLGQTVELISKIEYDEEKKNSFLSEVKDKLYYEHSDFLSIPLMVSMMLLTYSYFSEIPAKIHIFYRQAFDVLSQRHDRSKGVYTRKSYSGLSPDEFRDVFAYFCASTYIANKYEFGEGDTTDCISQSLSYCGLGAKPEDVKRDLIESACLLQRDGINITFVHRSFQEYFSAVFISKLDYAEARMMIEPLVNRAESDSVLEMMHEMEPAFFERAWVIPTIDNLLSKLDNSGHRPEEYGLVPDVFSALNISDDKITAGNSDSMPGNEAMALWMLFDIHLLADQWREENEPERALKAVFHSPELERSFLQRVGDDAMYMDFKKTGEIAELNPEDPGSVVSLITASDELMDALLVRNGIGREVKGWRKIKAEIEKRTQGKGASLAAIIRTAQG